MPHHTQDPALEQCIDACLDCYRVCRETAMHHCLELGGKHVEPTHFRLLSTCAELCRTAADVMLSGSPQHPLVCRACAAVCEACAASCADLGDMDECVEACNRCAEHCTAMARAVAGTESRRSGASQRAGH